MKRLRCPRCKRLSVVFRMRPNSEDNYACVYWRAGKGYRTCDWYAFTQGHDATDEKELQRLQQANPHSDL